MDAKELQRSLKILELAKNGTPYYGHLEDINFNKEVEEQNAVINAMEQEMDADAQAKGPNNTTSQGEEVEEQKAVINAIEQEMDADTKAKVPNNTTYQGE